MSNSIVSTPTKFQAGGVVNQLGEAGQEAIFPIERTAGGELGIKGTMQGGQQQQVAPNVNVPVRIVNVAESPQDYLGSSEGERVIVNIMNRNRGVLNAG
jgi:phage-related minor tail protein